MANTQVSINSNGTTTLATAGKYCDRNIDVNVNVPSAEEPTAFTNVLKHESTTVTLNTIAYVSGNTETSNGNIMVEIDLVGLGITTHPAEMTFRWRGMSAVKAIMSVFVSTDKATWSVATSINNTTIDEHGDFSLYKKLNYPTSNRYLRMFFARKYNDDVLTYADIENCILTINEPIGNGGYVGA